MTPSQFRDLRQPVADALKGFLNNGVPGYKGQTTAPLTAAEQAFVNAIGQAGQPSALSQQARQSLS